MNSKLRMIACENRLAVERSRQKPTHRTFSASTCSCRVERHSEVHGDSLRGRTAPLRFTGRDLAETAPGQKAADFGLPKGRRVSDEIQRVWLDAQELWSRFKAGREKLSEKDPHGTTLTRDRWIGPLLTDPVRLSYDLHYQPSAVVLEGLTFAISHRAGEGAENPPVHIEGCEIELDKRPPKYRTSPQAMVQEFSKPERTALVGRCHQWTCAFRLLRDSVRTARPTYLEFDLETILEGVHYNEFVLFIGSVIAHGCHKLAIPPKTAGWRSIISNPSRRVDESATNCAMESKRPSRCSALDFYATLQTRLCWKRLIRGS